MITGHGSVEKAVEAMRLGAYDFIQKPLDSAALMKTVSKALENNGQARTASCVASFNSSAG